MAKQTEILRAVVRHREENPKAKGMQIDELLASLGGKDTRARRKRIVMAVGSLIERKFLQRADRVGVRPVFYAPTPAGIAFVASGKRITCGPRGNLNGVRKPPQNSFRARIWRALRLQGGKIASLADLMELAREKTDKPDAANHARDYLTKLAQAGIVIRRRDRAAGFSLTSNGFTRWVLVNDLGPTAPTIRADHVFDHNERKKYPFTATLAPLDRKKKGNE